MKDVARILSAHCGDAVALLTELAQCESAQSNAYFAEMVRRIARAANVRLDGPPSSEPKTLLALMEEQDV